MKISKIALILLCAFSFSYGKKCEWVKVNDNWLLVCKETKEGIDEVAKEEKMECLKECDSKYDPAIKKYTIQYSNQKCKEYCDPQ